MKVSFNKVITKMWESHLEVWVAKRHLHGWHIYIYIYIGFVRTHLLAFMRMPSLYENGENTS